MIAAISGSFLIYLDFIKPNIYLNVVIIIYFLIAVLNQIFFFYLIILLWFIGLNYFLYLALTLGTNKSQIIYHLLLSFLLPLFVALSNLFIQIIGKSTPFVRDEFLMAIDGTLGFYPSLFMGRLNQALSGLPLYAVNAIYLTLPLAFIIVYRIRSLREEPPPIGFIIEAVFIAIFGFILYYVVPGCGSKYIFQSTWPYSVPNQLILNGPQLVQCPINLPRGCVPSLHTAWLICLIRHVFLCDRRVKMVMGLFSIGTIIALFGIGAHYLVDVMAGALFANIFGGLFAFKLPYNHPARWFAVILGTLFFLGWYYLILYGLPLLQTARWISWTIFVGSFTLSISLEFKLIKALKASLDYRSSQTVKYPWR